MSLTKRQHWDEMIRLREQEERDDTDAQIPWGCE